MISSRVKVSEKLSELMNCSKSQLRLMIHSWDRNVIKEADQLVSEYVFCDGTPFRFLKDYTVGSLDEAKLKLSRVLDTYAYLKARNSIVLARIDALRGIKEVDLITEEGKKRYKDLIKGWIKDNSLSLEQQLECSFLMSVYVRVTDVIKYHEIDDYVEKFAYLQPTHGPFIYHDRDEEAFAYLAEVIEQSHVREYNHISRIIPPPKHKFSSTGRMKCYDNEELLKAFDSCSTINREAKRVLLVCFKAIRESYEVTGIDNLIKKIQSLPEDDSLNFLEFLPFLSMVPQTKGKVARPVFCSNDFLDLALTRFMTLLKKMTEHLPSNFSHTSLYEKASMYSRVEKCSKRWHDGIVLSQHIDEAHRIIVDESITSDMEDIDSSNATERNSGLAHWECFMGIWNEFSDEFKASLDISEEYLEYVKELLLYTPYVYQTRDGSVGIAYTYGTAQGLVGSWDLLNLFTMCMIFLSYHEYLIEEDVRHYTRKAYDLLCNSGHNGDDGMYASLISQYIKQRMIENSSSEEVISLDKSISESEMGYLIFSSVYVRTYKTPKLSSLRFISLIEALSDPHIMRSYMIDIAMWKQIKILHNVIENFSELYNRSQYEVYLDPKEMKRAEMYSNAYSICYFQILNECTVRNIGVPREGTDIGVCKELTPSIRCRTVPVINSHISSTRYEIMITGQAVESCFEINDIQSDQFSRDIAEGKYEYVKFGKLPFINDSYYRSLMYSMLDFEHYKYRRRIPLAYCIDEGQFEQYTFNYEGYIKDDQIVSVKFKFQ